MTMDDQIDGAGNPNETAEIASAEKLPRYGSRPSGNTIETTAEEWYGNNFSADYAE